MVPAVMVEGIHCPLLLAASDADTATPFPLPAIFRYGGREWGENGAWSRSRSAESLREFLAMEQGMRA